MCGCFVIVSGSLGCCWRVWLFRGCFWFPQWFFSFPAGKPVSSPSRRHWFRKCWMGWGSYGTRNFANAIVASFLVSRHSVIKFRPCVLFMCSLALLRRPLSIHETCVQTHVEENLSDSKSEHVFCSSQNTANDFSWSARGINLKFVHLPCLLSFSESGGKSNNVRRIIRHNYLVVQCIIQRTTMTH